MSDPTLKSKVGTPPIPFDKPAAKVISLTGADATDLLSRNSHNRPMSQQAIAAYARDMVEGRWNYTGEAIKFSENGLLLDGQQRLAAHARVPDLSLDYLVVTGLPDESQRFMDQGRKRTAAQQLALLGYTNTTQLAAGVRFYILWQTNKMWGVKNRPIITAAEHEEWLMEHDDLYQTVKSRLGQCESAVHRAFLFRSVEVNQTDAFAFHDALNSLVGLPTGSPILALEHRLRRIEAARTLVQQHTRLGYFIQAWNSWCRDDQMLKMQTPKKGWTPTNFPEMLDGRGAQPKMKQKVVDEEADAAKAEAEQSEAAPEPAMSMSSV